MALSEQLTRLIDVSAPLWAGEAEVVRTYWDSPVRNHESELCGSAAMLEGVQRHRHRRIQEHGRVHGADHRARRDLSEDRHRRGRVDRRYALELIEILHDEFDHYARFADIYDAIRGPDTPPLNPHELETWPEEDALTATRHGQNAEYGSLGVRASRFTEGGYCTLFREGMRLKGRGGVDDMIAEACTKVYEDEFGHMLEGIIGLDEEAGPTSSSTCWKSSCSNSSGSASRCATPSSASR